MRLWAGMVLVRSQPWRTWSWAILLTEITSGEIYFHGQPLDELAVFEHARAGMFLSFQYPAVIPGVQVGTFLKKSVASVRDEPPKGRAFRKELNEAMGKLEMDKSFLSRYVNDGFSGGEKSDLKSFRCSYSSQN